MSENRRGVALKQNQERSTGKGAKLPTTKNIKIKHNKYQVTDSHNSHRGTILFTIVIQKRKISL